MQLVKQKLKNIFTFAKINKWNEFFFLFCTQDRLLQIIKNKNIWRLPMVLFKVLTKKQQSDTKWRKKVGSNKSNAMSCSTRKTMQKNNSE